WNMHASGWKGRRSGVPPCPQHLLTRMVRRPLRTTERGALKFTVSCILQLRGKDHREALGVDAEQAKVKQSVDVRPQKETIGHVLGARSGGPLDVCRLKGRFRIVAGDRTAAVVGQEQLVPELGLPPPDLDGSGDLFG